MESLHREKFSHKGISFELISEKTNDGEAGYLHNIVADGVSYGTTAGKIEQAVEYCKDNFFKFLG